MKSLKIIGLPIFILLYFIVSVPFQSCEPDDDDVPCDTCQMVYKPNIYLYPTERIHLTVQVDFPVGGEIVTSIPEYGTGWDIVVDQNGLIDSSYTYLFYESIQPDIWQRNIGWVSSKANLDEFFSDNMLAYGFYGQEIQDFIDYWIPKLVDYNYYIIYPQHKELIDDVIELTISKKPDEVLRLFYVIKGSNILPEKLTEPQINGFTREGFYVTEWGVILD